MRNLLSISGKNVVLIAVMLLLTNCAGQGQLEPVQEPPAETAQEPVQQGIPYMEENPIPKLVVQTGHAKEVSFIAFSPDGRILASASGDSTLKLWDVETGKELHTLSGHTEGVTRVAFSPNGWLLASGSRDTLVKLWNIYTGKEVSTLIGHTTPVDSLTFNFNGDLLASGDQNGCIRLWNVKTEQIAATLKKHTKEVSSLVFSPDGEILASGSWDRTITFWNIRTGKELRTLSGHSREVRSIAFSPNGDILASAGSDGTIKLWESPTGKELRTLQGHIREVVSVAFSPDGRTLVSGSWDHEIKIWDIGTGQEMLSFSEQAKGVGPVIISPNGRFLARGTGDGTIKLWKTASGEEVRMLTGNAGGIVSVQFSPNNYTLAGVSWDKTIKIWDTRPGKKLRTFIGHTRQVNAVAFSPDGEMLASGSADDTIKLWDVQEGNAWNTLTGHIEDIAAVAFSPTAPLLASGGWDKTMKLWDLQSGQTVHTLHGHSEAVLSAVFSPNGNIVASGSSDGTIKLWDVNTGKELRTLSGHTGWIKTAAFHPNGRILASGSWDKTIKLWDVDSGEELQTFKGHRLGVFTVAFSPNGNIVASGSGDNTIKLWDVESGQELRTLTGHSFWIFSVDFSSNGEVLVSGSLDKQIKLWDVQSGREIVSLIALGNEDWAVVTPQGQFDASPGAMRLMHWVIGLEPVELEQLKDRYYDPGLLQKLFGFNKEPIRIVPDFADLKLYPEIKLLEYDSTVPKAAVRLINRGGGIGRVMILLNGKEVSADARGLNLEPEAPQVHLNIDLTDHPFLIPGKPNSIEVKAYNAEGYLVSRSLRFECTPGITSVEEQDRPHLWAIVAGISDYQGEFLDLQFAAKDAENFAGALQTAAERLLGRDHVHLSVLTSPASPQSSGRPTRDNLIRAFKDWRQARSTDILVVYLAGHGFNHGGTEGDYYYPTAEAYTGNLDDSIIREHTTISSKELTELIRQIPALKQVLILDTCMSGRVIEELTVQRSIPSSQIRALERMKDRMGLYVLAGSAANAVSYETSRYGQGLLTYSLLLGMRGAALREGEMVDVSTLFDFAADQVPQLAKDIGGIQRPVVATPLGGSSFDIGRLISEDKERIPLAKVRPMILRANFQHEEPPFYDYLALAIRVNDSLRKISARGADTPLLFVDALEFPDAYALAGRYRVENERMTVTIYVLQGSDIVKQFVVEGNVHDLDKLTKDIAAALEENLGETAYASSEGFRPGGTSRQ